MKSKQLKLAFTVAGTVIGAGFATGKELLLFFHNEPAALFSLLLSVLLMGTVSLLYFRYLKNVTKKTQTSALIRPLFILFSGASYSVMLACGGEALQESIGLFFPVGTVLTFLITIGIVRFGAQNVYRFNLIATPVLLVCMAGISLAGLLTPVGLFETSQSKSINLLIYGGYNLLSVLPVLSALSDTVEKKEGYFGIMVGFFLVAAVGLLLKGFLLRFSHFTDESAIPVLTAISKLHNNTELLYTVMLYLSVLTTAVNGLYAVTKGKNLMIWGICLLGCSFLGFSRLIETLYPFFGYLGLGITVYLIINTYGISKEPEKLNRKDEKQWQAKKM